MPVPTPPLTTSLSTATASLTQARFCHQECRRQFGMTDNSVSTVGKFLLSKSGAGSLTLPAPGAMLDTQASVAWPASEPTMEILSFLRESRRTWGCPWKLVLNSNLIPPLHILTFVSFHKYMSSSCPMPSKCSELGSNEQER